MTYVIRVEKALTLPAGFNLIPHPVEYKDDRYHLDIFANVVSLYSPETMNADFLFIGKMFVDLDNKIMTIKLVRRAADQCGLLEAKLFCEDCGKFYTATEEYKKNRAQFI